MTDEQEGFDFDTPAEAQRFLRFLRSDARVRVIPLGGPTESETESTDDRIPSSNPPETVDADIEPVPDRDGRATADSIPGDAFEDADDESGRPYEWHLAEDGSLASVKHGTSKHEALTHIVQNASPTSDDGITTREVMNLFEDFAEGSVNDAVVALHRKLLVERRKQNTEAGSYEYRPTDAGVGEIKRLGEYEPGDRYDAGHGTARDAEPIKSGTGIHEVLDLISMLTDDDTEWVASDDIVPLVESIKQSTVAPTLTKLTQAGYVDRQRADTPQAKYEYSINEAGAAALDDLGPHPAHDGESAGESADGGSRYDSIRELADKANGGGA